MGRTWRILTLPQREEERDIWQKPDQENRHNIVVDRFQGADMRRALQVFYTQLARFCLDIVFCVLELVVILAANWIYAKEGLLVVSIFVIDGACEDSGWDVLFFIILVFSKLFAPSKEHFCANKNEILRFHRIFLALPVLRSYFCIEVF